MHLVNICLFLNWIQLLFTLSNLRRCWPSAVFNRKKKYRFYRIDDNIKRRGSDACGNHDWLHQMINIIKRMFCALSVTRQTFSNLISKIVIKKYYNNTYMKHITIYYKYFNSKHFDIEHKN